MSALKTEIKKAKEKIEKKTKKLLLEFDNQPEAWRWLERQASIHNCSKTTYVKSLIEVDRKGEADE